MRPRILASTTRSTVRPASTHDRSCRFRCEASTTKPTGFLQLLNKRGGPFTAADEELALTLGADRHLDPASDSVRAVSGEATYRARSPAGAQHSTVAVAGSGPATRWLRHRGVDA